MYYCMFIIIEDISMYEEITYYAIAEHRILNRMLQTFTKLQCCADEDHKLHENEARSWISCFLVVVIEED